VKKSELKKILKPIIKECIKESLYEEGLLKNIVSQVVEGYSAGTPKIVEEKVVSRIDSDEQDKHAAKIKGKLEETKKKMLNAIGSSAYGGVNVFEGTTPAPSEGVAHANPMEGVEPTDSGVDISSILNPSWGKMI
tara:strand:- start:822 stop:1226 length:405 start_codon:yes stop_codon:yes gene_type:complete